MSHAPISISVLLTMLFLGAQALFRIFAIVSAPIEVAAQVFAQGSPFAVISAVVAGLLLVFLGVDLRRNRIEARGEDRYQYAVFGLAALLLLIFLWWLWALGGAIASLE